ncbi:MAG: peptidyl-prolyl cis-trans isomerase [Actinobacteria bacterium]|nr:peptidyl-prolyl cis-trans isomerase [Actinomycetota bacterium]
MVVPLRSLILLLVTCAFALGAAACGGGDEQSSADVPPEAIALVGEEEIPKSEFDELIERAKTSYKQQKRPFPKAGTPEYDELKDRAVSYLVQRYEFREEAEELGIEVTDEELDARLAKIKKETFGGNDKTYRAELKRLGLTEEDAREQIRDVIIQEKLFEEVTKDVEVTDADVKAYYEKNKAQFSQPASRDVRHIVVKSRAKAAALYTQLTSTNADFAALAKKHSEDKGTAVQGGKYTAVKGQSVPEFDEVAFELDKGEISQPVKTQFGWHIIQATSEVKDAKATPLADVEDSIRQQLLQQKQSEAMRKWVEEMEKKYEDEIVYAAGYAPPKPETGTGETATTTE